jgi:hypothetical protein
LTAAGGTVVCGLFNYPDLARWFQFLRGFAVRVCLDFLRISRPDLGFSMGYGGGTAGMILALLSRKSATGALVATLRLFDGAIRVVHDGQFKQDSDFPQGFGVVLLGAGAAYIQRPSVDHGAGATGREGSGLRHNRLRPI